MVETVTVTEMLGNYMVMNPQGHKTAALCKDAENKLYALTRKTGDGTTNVFCLYIGSVNEPMSEAQVGEVLTNHEERMTTIDFLFQEKHGKITLKGPESVVEHNGKTITLERIL